MYELIYEFAKLHLTEVSKHLRPYNYCNRHSTRRHQYFRLRCGTERYKDEEAKNMKLTREIQNYFIQFLISFSQLILLKSHVRLNICTFIRSTRVF